MEESTASQFVTHPVMLLELPATHAVTFTLASQPFGPLCEVVLFTVSMEYMVQSFG